MSDHLIHAGCGGEVPLNKAVPFCKKCGKSKKRVEKDNAAVAAVVATPEVVMEEVNTTIVDDAGPINVPDDDNEESATEHLHAPKPKRVKALPVYPVKVDPKVKFFLKKGMDFDPKTYDPETVDHSPLNSKESERANKVFDTLQDLKWSTAAQRRDPAVWRKILTDVEGCIKMALDDGDITCAQHSKAIWIEALLSLGLRPQF